MRRKGKAFTGIAAAALAALMSAAPVLAAGTYTPVPGGEMPFYKELVMDSDANIPGASFQFSIAPVKPEWEGGKTVILAGNGTLEVLNGPMGTDADGNSAPSISEVTFTAGEGKEAATGKTVETKNGKTTVKKETKINFTGVNFPEPGVYRYLVTEQDAADGTNQGITNDPTSTRIVDVYVVDQPSASGTKTLAVASYIMYKGNAENPPKSDGTLPEGAKKTDTYTNTYDTSNLTFGKEVTGNQGSKDKYFKFTVTITAAPGTEYEVDVTKADKEITHEMLNAATTCITSAVTNPESLTVGSKGTVSGTFYLQDGQYITIRGLASGTAYKVTEDAEDYTGTSGISASNSSFTLAGATEARELMDEADGTIGSADIYTGYTNDRTGTIPTGINLSVLPALLIGLIAVGGIAVLGLRARRRKI